MTDRDARHFAPERHAAILQALEDDGRVVSAQVAARLGVSIDTVRRDLADLEAAGALRRVHGGAVRPAPGPRRFADRLGRDDEAKALLAGLAAGLVARGEVAAFGGGTTMLLTARRLAHDLEATVVTASPDVALALRDHTRVEVDLLGGRLHRVSQTLTGAETVAQVESLRPDVCLVSPCGVDAEAGVSLRERDEACVVRALIARSRRLVVVAGAAKLGAAGPYVVASAADVDVLVTDAEPEALGDYAQLGAALVTPAAPAVPPTAAVGA